MLTAQEIITHLGLEPLPIEGGYYTRSYYSDEIIPHAALPTRYHTDKPLGGAIYYLLTDHPDSFSALHLLPTDEIYHFYLGDPVELIQLYPDGRGEKIILGQDILNGQVVQYTAPKGVWQGSRLMAGGKFALLGTTMAPAFTDDDYVGGERATLLQHYPQMADWITALTRVES